MTKFMIVFLGKVRCDPALQTSYFFSPCLTAGNPPYSISNWDREAFSTDKYGRNFLGTPPQGRADYAFIQHILKSMDPETGRCAILLPHGVLFRGEEADMRTNLVKSDLVEAVIGIGKNLFYNSPMEACILVCRSKKPINRIGKTIFINARHEVTRKNAESYLEDRHIEKIATAYSNFNDIPGFAKVVDQQAISENKYKMSIALYVRGIGSGEIKDSESAASDYVDGISAVRNSCEKLIGMISEGGAEGAL